MPRHEFDRPRDAIHVRLFEEPVYPQPGPAGAEGGIAKLHFAFVAFRGLAVDAQEMVAIRPGTGTPAARLNAEQIVEQGDDVVVMQHPPADPQVEGEDPDPCSADRPQQFQPRNGAQGAFHPVCHGQFAFLDLVLTDRALQRQNHARADVLDDRGCPAFFAPFGVRDVFMVVFGNVGHGTAACHCRPSGVEKGPVRDQQSRGAGPARILVRGHKCRVDPVRRTGGAFGQRNLHVGTGGGEIGHAPAALRMHQPRDAAQVADHAGHVRGRSEGSDLHGGVRVGREPRFQRFEANGAVRVQRDTLDAGPGFAPRQIVGMVLVGADKDD